MTKFLDALFCYYYVVCKEKVWFANDSYKLYALAFSAGASAVVIYLNTLFFLSILGFEVGRGGIPEFGLSRTEMVIIFYLFMFLIMLFLGFYLKKDNKANKLVKELAKRNYSLSKASIWMGRVYKAAFILPILFALILHWY